MTLHSIHEVQYCTAEWILLIGAPPIHQGVVAIQDGKIQSVGPLAEYSSLLALSPPQPGTFLTPGLVNTHVHLEQGYLNPIPKAANEDFVDWLLKVIAVTRTGQSPADKLARCMAGAEESLKAGVTCVNDIISGPESIQAIQAVGLRAQVALEVFHPGFDPIELSRWVSLYDSLQAQVAGFDRITLGLSPHSPYNVSLKAWRASLAALNPPFIHTHWAEFDQERRYLAGQESRVNALHRQVLGRSFDVEHPSAEPVKDGAEAGLYDRSTVLAHAVDLTSAERLQLEKFPVSIAHCPRSNLALHGKTLHWADWETSRLPLGLGTDGRLSTPDLDLREEARVAMCLHGWSAQKTLEVLTLGGAQVLGMDAQIGSISPGKQADLVLWQGSPTSATHGSQEALALDANTAAQTVWINGQVRYSRKQAT